MKVKFTIKNGDSKQKISFNGDLKALWDEALKIFEPIWKNIYEPEHF